ncbi:MAG: hypothetical protein WKG32_09760 [Gemmatimonadaceae bacterium]
MTYATGEFAIAALSGLDIEPTGADTAQQRGVRHMLTDEPRPLDFELSFANGARIGMSLSGSGQEPSSLWRVLESFRRLSKLPAGWDSYGAQPLSATAVRRCFNLFSALLPDDAPEPTVIPTRDGGVQFEWHRRGIDLEVKVPSAGPISYLFVDANTGEEREDEGKLDLQVVQDAFARMSQVD